ncbi:MAG: sigma-70 family RNA polymerase sigma factor [Candidatus Pacearchaeota archaeon]|jgi:RNA polymerase sigma factor (sigma-70 family)|nr:sigma-70 family RNA polymerase sigma factor [Clostridia bacterium]
MAQPKSQIQDLANAFIETKSEKRFKILMNRLKPGVLKKIATIETDPESRQEIVNIVFAKVWQNIDQYNPGAAAFSTWIYRIAYNECLLAKRHTNRTKSLDRMFEEGTVNESAISIDSDFDEFDTKPKYDVVEVLYNKTIDAINGLKDSGKEGIIKTALIKWHVDKKPYKTIAEEMSIPENSAKNKVFRGKDLIRKILVTNEPELVQLFAEDQKYR